MADSSRNKRPAIPDWQKTYIQSSTTPESPTKDHALNLDDTRTSDAPLLEQAKRWLEDESIRDAPTERRVSFLEQKGLQRDDIQKLLGTQNTPEQESEMKTVHDSASAPSATKAASPMSSNIPTTTSTSSTSSRDVPPIITYPEFLLRPEKPPPLVTFQRLAYATYGFAGLTALTYGASRYLVQPMLDSLTSARHEFAETTLQNLEKLNSKLESTVSHVPYMSSSAVLKRKAEEHHDEEDLESIDSDPTELFHRDIATQTSLLQSRKSSLSSSTSLNHVHRDANPTSIQSTRLSTIHTSLTSLLASTIPSSVSPNATESLKSTVKDLQTYLDNLQFSTNSLNASNYDHIFPGFETQKTSAKKNKTGEDDGAEKFKAEIRAVKGALLSSRTFPAGRKPVGTGSGMGMVVAR
jgi:hypothetical protein